MTHIDLAAWDEPNCKDRGWLEELVYSLMREDDVAFGLFLHKIYIHTTMTPFMYTTVPTAEGMLAFSVPACIGMRADGTLQMMLDWNHIEKLPFEARRELIKHEVLHVVFGHCGSRLDELREVYSQQVMACAVDCVVNQFIDCDIMEATHLKPTTIETYDLPKDLMTREYCELLADLLPEGEQGQQLVKLGDGMTIMAPGDAPPGTPILIPWEVFDFDKDKEQAGASNIRDLNLHKLLSEVKSDAERRGASMTDGSKNRGWGAGEATEWFDQLQRSPTVPWHQFLRSRVEYHRTSERVPSRLRPSRRHPAFWGRRRTESVVAWWCTDTSGSMGPELHLVEAEMKGLVARGVDLWHLHIDGDIAAIEKFERHSGVGEFAGRGGTDFSPGLNALHDPEVLSQIPQPSLLIYYTDGYGGVSGWEAEMADLMGQAEWETFKKNAGIYTPTGVELLWLLPEGNMDVDEFVEGVCDIGTVMQVPAAEAVEA